MARLDDLELEIQRIRRRLDELGRQAKTFAPSSDTGGVLYRIEDLEIQHPHDYTVQQFFGAAGYPIDVAATEADGTSASAARSDHRHAHGSGYLPDAHHNDAHTHIGTYGTFPTVAATNTSNDNVDTSSHTVSLPSGIVAGNLLIVVFVVNTGSASITFPAGWTQITSVVSTDTRLVTRYREADGTEGATITVTTGDTGRSAHISYRITGASPISAQVPEGATLAGSNPPSVTPTGGSKNYLWIVGGGTVADGTGITAPTNYSSLLGAYGSLDCMSARRDLVAVSEDPGAWLGTGTVDASATIAIHPSALTGVIIKEAGVVLGDPDILTLDFQAGFDLTESPNQEVNISLDASEVSAAPTSVDIGDTQVTGALATFANADHQHAVTAPGAGYPLDVAATEADGSATTPARSDHVHAHGSGYAHNVTQLITTQDLALQGDITPPDLGTGANNYDPTGLSTATVLRLSSTAGFCFLTGLAGGADGRMILLLNDSSSVPPIILISASGASDPANRFDTPTGTAIFPGQGIWIIYDSTLSRWRIASHGPYTLVSGADTVFNDANTPSQRLGFLTQIANTILAGPTSGAAAIPAFRALVAADIPHTLDNPTAHSDVAAMTEATGDIIYRNSSGQWDRLAVGERGQVLLLPRNGTLIPDWDYLQHIRGYLQAISELPDDDILDEAELRAGILNGSGRVMLADDRGNTWVIEANLASGRLTIFRGGEDDPLLEIDDEGKIYPYNNIVMSRIHTIENLYSEHHYVFVPDAAAAAVVVAGNQQGGLHHTGSKQEIATRLYVDAETTPGAAGLPITIQYSDTDDLDTDVNWTTIATLTLSSEGSAYTDSMTNQYIPANRLLRMNVGTIVGSPADVSVTLRVKRQLIP